MYVHAHMYLLYDLNYRYINPHYECACACMYGRVRNTCTTTLKMSLSMHGAVPCGTRSVRMPQEFWGFYGCFQRRRFPLPLAFSVSPPNWNQGLLPEVCVFGCSVSPPNWNQGLLPEVCVFGCRTRGAVVCTGHDRLQSTERQATLLASSPPPPHSLSSLFRRPWK